MELNAEINKVFGQEMAKIFYKKIPEEELERMARGAYEEIIKFPTDRWDYNKKGNSELTELIKELILNKTMDFIKKELEKPESEDIIQQRAERIVANAKDIAEKEITAKIASSFVNQAIRVDYNDYERNEIIQQMMNRLSKIEQEHSHF